MTRHNPYPRDKATTRLTALTAHYFAATGPKPPLTSRGCGRLSNEGHGFSRVPMSLRLTQGDENHLDLPIMILRGLEVVFDCAVNAPADEGFSP